MCQLLDCGPFHNNFMLQCRSECFQLNWKYFGQITAVLSLQNFSWSALVEPSAKIIFFAVVKGHQNPSPPPPHCGVCGGGSWATRIILCESDGESDVNSVAQITIPTVSRHVNACLVDRRTDNTVRATRSRCRRLISLRYNTPTRSKLTGILDYCTVCTTSKSYSNKSGVSHSNVTACHIAGCCYLANYWDDLVGRLFCDDSCSRLTVTNVVRNTGGRDQRHNLAGEVGQINFYKNFKQNTAQERLLTSVKQQQQFMSKVHALKNR